jgi:signal transduction histidine kinase
VGRFHGAFALERERLIARRLPFAGRVVLIAIGAAAVADAAMHPDQTPLLLGLFAAQIVLCLGAAQAVERGDRWRWASRLAGTIAVVLGMFTIAYLERVRVAPASIGMVVAFLLAAASLLLPWGARVQAAVSVGVCAGFALLVPDLWSTAYVHPAWIPVVIVAALAIIGAAHVDRYREDAFVRAACETEERRAMEGVARVGETLQTHLQAPDLWDRVCRIALEELPCDWAALSLLDDAEGRYVLAGFAASTAQPARADLADYTPAANALPAFEELERRGLVEIRNARRQTLLPAALVERFQIGAGLCAAIWRDGRVVGVIACAFLTPRRELTSVQRRFVTGIAHIVGIAVENRRLIEQVEEASSLKSEFVATMSHELRTPLSVIGGYTELLEEGVFGPVTSEQRDTLGRIHHSSLALLELVNTTLDLGRLETGREAVTPSVFGVHDLVEEIRAEQQALVAIGVQHRWDYEFDLQVYVDRAKVKTILKNLVGNALKFTAAGRVDVRIVWYEDVLRLDVEDTGIGIATADLQVIFEAFRQADASSTRRDDGAGLGLHIVQRLTTLQGGTVEVESEPGRGSIFRVRIPCPRADAGARRSA